jgi:prevent-host-death family protein
MRTIGSRELKNRLGRYLGLVRRGEKIVITDRGKPVAHMIPAPSETSESTVMDVLRRLEVEGHLKLGTRPFRRFKPVRTKGKPASQMIIEDRD